MEPETSVKLFLDAAHSSVDSSLILGPVAAMILSLTSAILLGIGGTMCLKSHNVLSYDLGGYGIR